MAARATLDVPGPSARSWCRARLGLPLSFRLRMIPHSQGKQELQPPASRKCSSSHGSVGKAHSHLLLQHHPFPCSSSLSMSVNTTQSSLLGCCGCSVTGRDVCVGTTRLWALLGWLWSSVPQFPCGQSFTVRGAGRGSEHAGPAPSGSQIHQWLDWMISRGHFNPDKSGILPSG